MHCKRILSILLALCLLAATLPTAVLTVGAASNTLEASRITAYDHLNESVDLSTADYITDAGNHKSGTTEGEGPHRVFDGSFDTKVGANIGANHTATLSFQTTTPVTVTAYTLGTANDSEERDPRSWTFYGSVDGNEYVELSTVSEYQLPSSRKVFCDDDFLILQPTAYSYYKLVITDFKSNSSGVYSQFSQLVLSGYDTSEVLHVIGEIEDVVAMEDGDAKKAAVQQAYQDYLALEIGQSNVINYGDLLVAMGEDGAKVSAAIAAITAIGEVTYRDSSKALIDAADAAYEAVPEAYRSMVYNADLLPAAKAQYQDYMENGWVTVSGWQTSSGWNLAPWLYTATAAQQQATWDAVVDEVVYQYQVVGYDFGQAGAKTIGNWMDLPSVSFENAVGDNVGNPWGNEGRYVSWVCLPFTGMAFSNNGYFAKHFSYQLNISSPFTYQGKTYLMNWTFYQYYETQELSKEQDVNMLSANVYPGWDGSADASNNTFRYAYANYNQTYKWDNLTMGIPENVAVWTDDGSMLCQTFVSDCGQTALVNTADRIHATDSNSEESMKTGQAYVLSGPVLSYVLSLGTSLKAALEVTGAPLANAVTAEDGTVRQDFDNMTIVVAPDGSVKKIDKTATIYSVSSTNVAAASVVDDSITLLLTEDANPKAVQLNFVAADEATLDPASGSYFDLSGQNQVTVTSEKGTVVYAIQAYSASAVTEADQAAAATVQAMVDALPVTVFRQYIETAQETIAAYENLTKLQQLLVTGSERLQAAKNDLSVLEEESIRITCVGSSVTYGAGASNEGQYSYPAQLQKLLGNGFTVTNCGASGSTIVTDVSSLESQPDINPYYREGEALGSNPDIVIMFIGSNDLDDYRWNTPGYPALFKSSYETLIDKFLALDSQPDVILCYPSQAYTGGRNTHMEEYMDIIDQLAEEYGFLVCEDIFQVTDDLLTGDDWATYFNSDKLHPTDAGYAVMAQTIYDFMTQDYIPTKLSNTVATSISVGDTALAGFDPSVTAYTLKLTDDEELPQVTASAPEGYQVTVTQATKESPVAYVAVTSSVGSYGSTYTVQYDIEHDYQVTDQKDATCEEGGYITYTCSGCGDTYTETIPATGHRNLQGLETVEATCSGAGYIRYVCLDCGKEIIVTTDPALPHTPGEWVVTKAPTLTEEGEETLFCTVCGEVLETRVIAKLTAANYQVLDRYIGEAEGLARELYTEESLAVMDAVLATAKAVDRALTADDQETVDIAAAALLEALDGLVVKTSETTDLPGDLNGDGKLSVTDVVLLRKAILAGTAAADVPAGDLNHDGSLSVTDVVLLRKAILANG